MLRAYKGYFARLKEMRKKSLHCVKCGGGIWFSKSNLKAFFKAWYWHDFDNINISELKNLIRAKLRLNLRLETEIIHRNVLKLLHLLGSGPPIDIKGFQIANYEDFFATLP